jgi:hypothetical protein
VPPLRRGEQRWVSTGRPVHLAGRVSQLEQAHFVEAVPMGDVPVSTKPFDLGLYTSTAFSDTHGMWWILLQLNRGSSLFPYPWTIWSLDVAANAKVLEITTATEWVEFVSAASILRDGLLYPNWKLVARRWDAIRMTVAAVAATQGIPFLHRRQICAPPYWGVESTLWLRWVFSEVELIEVVEKTG